MRRLILAVVAILLLPATAHADSYVSPSGSGTACTATAPCSVSQANSAAVPGTVVHVASGTYGSASFSKSGSSSGRITWVASTKWGPHFSTVSVPGFYVDVQGMDVGNVNTGILFTIDGSYSRAIGNFIHDNLKTTCDGSGGAGLELEGWQSGSYRGTGMAAIGNVVTRIGRSGCGRIQGIYLTSPGNLVANNFVSQIDNYGLHDWHNASSNTYVNNTVVNSGSCAVIGNGDNYSPGPYVNTGGIFRNNICSGNGFNGVALENASGTTIQNNLFAPSCSSGCGTSAVLAASAGFVSATDFHLASGSPAIDRGTSASAPSTDIDGDLRPQGAGFDIGADEVGASSPPPTGDSTPPTAPTNLHRDDAATTTSTIWFFWTAATDNVGVDHYREYRDGNLVDSAVPASTTHDWVGGSLAACTDHTVGVEAVDAVGNVGPRTTVTMSTAGCTTPTPAPDTTPPDTILTSAQTDGSSTGAYYDYKSTEPGSTFKCQYDSMVGYPCPPPRWFPDQALGTHTFTVWAIDAAGNIDPTPAVSTWTRTS